MTRKKDPKSPITILQAIESPQIFGSWFKDRDTWAAWIAFLKSMFGLRLGDAELAIFKQCTNRSAPLTSGYLEATLIVGRRGGKSLIMALVAAYLGSFFDWRPYLTEGERGVIMIVAADRRQATTIFKYLRGMLGIPLLSSMIERETLDTIELSNSITIEIQTASFKTIRGRTVVAFLADELAFWSDENSANPDIEIINAAKPAMATIPRAIMIKASSPYARRGALWNDYKKHFGKDDSSVLVWQASTRTMNPSVPESFIAAAFEDDPASASAEYGGGFRVDVENFVNADAVAACVVSGRYELPAIGGVIYSAFLDASGGSGTDSMTLCITHREGDRVVVDAIREVKPPFSPETVVLDFVQLLKAYRVVDNVTADRFAGLWVAERFRVHGIQCLQAAKPKSDLYRDFLPIINSGSVELIDHPKAIAQICGLERRTARGGRDSIDHAPGAHDDLANVIAGAVVGTAISQGGAEGWIEFYRRQVEEPGRHNTDFDDFRVSGPEFGFSFSTQPLVSITLPPPIDAEGTCVGPRTGERYYARHIGAAVVVQVRRNDAAELLKNPTWRSHNADLAREIIGESA